MPRSSFSLVGAIRAQRYVNGDNHFEFPWVQTHGRFDQFDSRRRGGKLVHQIRTQHGHLNGGFMEGKEEDAALGRIFRDYPLCPLEWLPVNGDCPPILNNRDDELVAAATSGVASLKNQFDATKVTTFFAELADGLPNLEASGRNAFDSYGKAYMQQDFVWNATVRDLVSLWDFSRSPGFTDIKTSVKFPLLQGVTHSFASEGQVLNSYGASVIAPHTISSVTQDVDIFASIKPGVEFISFLNNVSFPADLGGKLDLARKGISVDLKVVWDLIPFSWLIDWSANVGEYLAAHSNSAGYILDECWAGITTTESRVCYEHMLDYNRDLYTVGTDARSADYFVTEPATARVKYNPNADSAFGGLGLVGAVRRTFERRPLELGIIPELPSINLGRAGTLSALSSRMASRFFGRTKRPEYL